MIYINGRFLTQSLTGVQRFSFELSKELIQLRKDVVILVPLKDMIVDKTVLDIFNIEETGGRGGHYWEQVTLPRYLKLKGFPLLINLCNTAPIFYKNKIVTHHDVAYLRYPKSFSLKFRFAYKIIIPLILISCKKIITVSEFSKYDISSVYNIKSSKFEVVYNAVNSDFRYDSTIEKRFYCLAVSSPSLHKNFHRLIDAFLASNSKLDLYIIGGQVGSFNKLSYQSDNRIKFIGRVTDCELIKYYQEASFFIFPSLYEGFGIPPLEAQACGCPVLASNAASIPEVLGNSALYFNPNDIVDIKNTIEKASVDDELKLNLMTLGFLNVKKYSWHNSALKLNKVIEEVK